MDKQSEAYKLHRQKMAARMRALAQAGAECGPIPEIFDKERRESTREDLKRFCEVYRPNAFHLGWSTDHLTVIDRLQDTAMHGGLFGLAMPRGSGKTTLSVTAGLWALLHGWRRWVCLIGATGPKAQQLLKSMKTELRFNALLLEDFPEACWPIKALDGRAARAAGQTLDGKNTSISWLSDSITFPTVPGSVSSGAVVTVAGITGDIRGQQQTTQEGQIIRPDYAILDDPQTRESAKSPTQTEDRLAILNGDILGLAGPGIKISGVMPCTVIQRGDMADQILDRELSPEWHGERTQMIYGMPKRMDLWEQYQEIRETEFRNNGDGTEATEFYQENREAMDEGPKVAWEDNCNEDEVSGLQHAMNLFFRDEPAFWAEYMNQPLDAMGDDTLTEEQITQRVNPFDRGVVPLKADLITAFVDVQKNLLYYVVVAWSKNFTGWVLDYGAFPDQGTHSFRYKQARKTIGKRWPGKTFEAGLRKSLDELLAFLLQPWTVEDGDKMSVSRVLIDANWGDSRNIIYDYVRHHPDRSKIFPSHGKFVGASSEPLNARSAKKVGQRIGMHWRTDKAKDSPQRYALYDTNFWKSFMFSRMGTEPNTPGSLTLYQQSPAHHRPFAKQLKAEYPVETEGRGRTVDEWKAKPSRDDNHWFDCIVGNCVAASIERCDLPKIRTKSFGKGKAKPKRKKVTAL